jgi:hypothetical protein
VGFDDEMGHRAGDRVDNDANDLATLAVATLRTSPDRKQRLVHGHVLSFVPNLTASGLKLTCPDHSRRSDTSYAKMNSGEVRVTHRRRRLGAHLVANPLHDGEFTQFHI